MGESYPEKFYHRGTEAQRHRGTEIVSERASAPVRLASMILFLCVSVPLWSTFLLLEWLGGRTN
jgi:hypothetical protein